MANVRVHSSVAVRLMTDRTAPTHDAPNLGAPNRSGPNRDVQNSAALRLAITGTDTGVGKTVVATALAARARQLGIRVAAIKPIETGVDNGLSGSALSDAVQLHRATGGEDAMGLVGPCTFREPLAPMVAASRAGVSIDLTQLDAAANALARDRDLLVVEGAGGLLVPITATFSMLDLFARWHCELLLVARNKLGVLNHVMLTLRVAQAAGVTVRGVVLTANCEGATDMAVSTNYDAMVSLLPAHSIFRFPWLGQPADHDALAAAVARNGMDVLLRYDPPVPTAPDTLFLD